MRVSRIAALALPALLAAGSAGAYPIPPVTLWQLAKDADVVVLAQVIRVDSPERGDGDHFARDTAHLKVHELWKGDAYGSIEVAFGRGVICPAPPRYEPGETVLAFLHRGATALADWGLDANSADARRTAARLTGRYVTVGLSYGTLYPRDEELPFLRDLVADALALQSRPTLPEGEGRAWHVRAASRRVTRWQGLYGLMTGPRDALARHDWPRPSSATPSADERREVMRGFIEEPSADDTVAMTLKFAGHQPEPEFDRAVLGQIERVLAGDEGAYWLPDAMRAVLERFGSKDAERDLRFKEPDDYRPPHPKALRAAWRKARVLYEVPEVPPAAAPPSEMSGVGGLTPD